MTSTTKQGAGLTAWSRRRVLAALSLSVMAKPAKAEAVTVEIRQFKFAPAEIEVAVGGTVTFVNLDLAPHTATGDSFDTGTLRRGDRKEVAFPTAGVSPFFCRFHRQMTGRIVVR